MPYVDICKAAIIPAILYFADRLLDGAPRGRRARLLGLPKDECPDPWRRCASNWYLLLPLAALVCLLFAGYTPLFSGTVGLALTVC